MELPAGSLSQTNTVRSPERQGLSCPPIPPPEPQQIAQTAPPPTAPAFPFPPPPSASSCSGAPLCVQPQRAGAACSPRSGYSPRSVPHAAALRITHSIKNVPLAVSRFLKNRPKRLPDAPREQCTTEKAVTVTAADTVPPSAHRALAGHHPIPSPRRPLPWPPLSGEDAAESPSVCLMPFAMTREGAASWKAAFARKQPSPVSTASPQITPMSQQQ